MEPRPHMLAKNIFFNRQELLEMRQHRLARQRETGNGDVDLVDMLLQEESLQNLEGGPLQEYFEWKKKFLQITHTEMLERSFKVAKKLIRQIKATERKKVQMQEAKEKEAKEKDTKEKEAKEKEANEREAKEKEAKGIEAKEVEAEEMEAKEMEAKEMEAKEMEAKEMDAMENGPKEKKAKMEAKE